MQNGYDPVRLAEETEKIVVKGVYRKYYRLARPSKWHDGISEAYCCGCCLRCVLCWSGYPRDYPEAIGGFYSPETIFQSLAECARKQGFRQLRIKCNEPTLGWDHLKKMLELVDRTDFFILETNGILIDHDIKLAKQLSRFRNLHVRVSLKGTNREEFARLTGANPEGFDIQLKTLENLLDAGVSFHPVVMLSFSKPASYERLKQNLRIIHESLPHSIEKEYVILYPPVVEQLKKRKLLLKLHLSQKKLMKVYIR